MSSSLTRFHFIASLLFGMPACGGALAGSLEDASPGDDASRHDAASTGHDAGDARPHTTLDAGTDATRVGDALPDRASTVDAGPPDVTTSDVACSAPFLVDGGGVFPCERAACPAATVCIQTGGAGPEPVSARCVGIPARCAGNATCACMGGVAADCAFPGLLADASGAGGGCTDLQEGDASFLNFACLACQ